jgi:hypothetical protein
MWFARVHLGEQLNRFRPRFTVRSLMVVVAVAGLISSLAAYEQRLKGWARYHEARYLEHITPITPTSSIPGGLVHSARLLDGTWTVRHRKTPLAEWHDHEKWGYKARIDQINIASMMAAILIIALSFAALRINSAFCGGIILLATLALLCSAIFMSLAESGSSRLAWIGCAVFGWPCFILGFGPVTNERLGPPRTTAMFEEAIPYINPALASEIKKYTPPGRLEVTGYSEPPGNVAGYVPELQRYRQSSHSVLTLGFAAMGAILGYSHAVRRNRAAGTEEAVTSEP